MPDRWSISQGDWLDEVQEIEDQSLDLLYVDPPFNTGLRQSAHSGSFHDSWASTDAWVDWFRARIVVTLPKLKRSGSLLIHVDWRTSHRVRILLEGLLGEDRFVNHLIWRYGLGGSSPRRFARKHDDILFYCIDPGSYYFDPPMIPATSNRMKGQLKKATDVLDVPALNNMSNERVGYPDAETDRVASTPGVCLLSAWGRCARSVLRIRNHTCGRATERSGGHRIRSEPGCG